MDSARTVNWRTAASVIAVVLAVVALWALWRVEASPLACPAIYPPPASCATDPHLALAVTGTVVLSVLLLALVVALFVPPAYRALAMATAAILVGIASLVLILVTLLSGSLTMF